MKLENRSIAKCIILSFVTCGIYAIVWALKVAKDAVHVKDVNDEGTTEAILTIFFPFVGFYLSEKKFAEGCAQKGIAHEDRSILYLVLGLFGLGLVDFILMQSELNKLADMGVILDAPANFSAPYTQPQGFNNPPFDNNNL